MPAIGGEAIHVGVMWLDGWPGRQLHLSHQRFCGCFLSGIACDVGKVIWFKIDFMDAFFLLF
jgi:hypothetical protein